MNRPVRATDRTSKGRRIKSRIRRRDCGWAGSGSPLLWEAPSLAKAGRRIEVSMTKIESPVRSRSRVNGAAGQSKIRKYEGSNFELRNADFGMRKRPAALRAAYLFVRQSLSRV